MSFKITAAARDLLEAVAAGHVTGEYWNRSTWYSAAAPRFGDMCAERFSEFDPQRRRSYNVSSRVCDLIAKGLATVEAGDVSETPALSSGEPIRHMRAAVVLTDAGREALGLEPATTPGPAAGSPAAEGEGAGPAAYGAGASGGTFAGLIITGPATADAVRHAEAVARRAVLGSPAPAATTPDTDGPWEYGMCRFCNNAIRRPVIKGELWAVRGPFGEDLVECPYAPNTPGGAEKRHEPAALPGLAASPAPFADLLDALGPAPVGGVVAATAEPAPAADDASGWPKYTTCRFCRHTMRMDGPGEPWTVHGPAGTTYTQCSDAPNPDDCDMPPHEPGTAVLSPPAADAVPDAPAGPTPLGTTPPPVPRIPRIPRQ